MYRNSHDTIQKGTNNCEIAAISVALDYAVTLRYCEGSESDGHVGQSQLFTGTLSRFSMNEHGGFRDLHQVCRYFFGSRDSIHLFKSTIYREF